MRQDSDRWRHVGRCTVADSLTVPNECAPYIADGGLTISRVSRVIRLRRLGD
jgi:hypothetical protein